MASCIFSRNNSLTIRGKQKLKLWKVIPKPPAFPSPQFTAKTNIATRFPYFSITIFRVAAAGQPNPEAALGVCGASVCGAPGARRGGGGPDGAELPWGGGVGVALPLSRPPAAAPGAPSAELALNPLFAIAPQPMLWQEKLWQQKRDPLRPRYHWQVRTALPARSRARSVALSPRVRAHRWAGSATWRLALWGFGNCSRVVRGSGFICHRSRSEEHFMPREFGALKPGMCHGTLFANLLTSISYLHYFCRWWCPRSELGGAVVWRSPGAAMDLILYQWIGRCVPIFFSPNCGRHFMSNSEYVTNKPKLS